MSSYTKATNFATKDTLPSGDSNKIVKGTEIDNEFNAISGAVSSKADLASPTFTGTPAAPTATAGSNTTQLANTAFVKAAVDALGTFGTMSTQNKTAVDITGGTIVGITDLAVADGGTGQGSYTNGQLLIGNSTGNTLTKSTLTAGSNITITNGNGAITIAAASGGGGSVTSVATGNGLSGGTITSTGTLVIAAPSADSIGSYAGVTGQGGPFTFGSNYAAGSFNNQLQLYSESVDLYNNRVSFTRGGSSISGTWKWLSAPSPSLGSNEYVIGIAVRVA